MLLLFEVALVDNKIVNLWLWKGLSVSKVLESLKAPSRCIKHTVRSLGPRAFSLILCSFIWIQVGIGTIQGYSGKPADAPHLLISGDIRGYIWILCAVIAFFLALRKTIEAHRWAIIALAFMPVVRLVSYLLSWVLYLEIAGEAFDKTEGLQGSASALYGSISWQAMLLLLVVIMFLPLSWSTVSNYLSEEEEIENAQVEPEDDSKPRYQVEG